MVKKGKKKKQAAAAASTSAQTSAEKSEEQASPQQQEEQEQTSLEALPGSSKQQKKSKGPKQQQVISDLQVSQSQHQQEPWGSSRQISQDQPQQQSEWAGSQLHGAWARPRQQNQPQQQQSAWASPQQQVSPSQPQQPQGAWARPHQQIPQGQPQQQQSAWASPQQQVSPSQPQQLQGAWARSHQQIPQGQSQQQQSAWASPQQQVSPSWPQQPQGAWARPHQQISQGQPQQQQSAWASPQQVSPSQPQQPLGAWARPQQQMSQYQPQQQQNIEYERRLSASDRQQQQQSAWTQQQQKASIAAGDYQRKVGDDSHRRQSSSAAPLDISGLTLIEPSRKEKQKMSSEQMKLYHEMIPKRSNPQSAGKSGQRITVFTNMFEIIFNDKFVTTAIHYDIDIHPLKTVTSSTETTPKKGSKPGGKKEIKIPKFICRDIFEQCRHKHFKKRFPAYDGNKNAFSANDLPFSDYLQDVFTFTPTEGQTRQFEIILKKVAHIDLSWIKNLRPSCVENRDQAGIQVLDIIMRHGPESRFMNVGRSLFWDLSRTEPLGGTLNLGYGAFMAGALGWRPYLNVDVTHKGFTTTVRVLEYIAEVTRMREEDLTHSHIMRYSGKIKGFLKGLKVTYVIPNSPISKRTYRVQDLSDDCNTHNFKIFDKTYTITRYYREIKKYNIKRPDLPTLHVGQTLNKDKVLVPLELCTIVGGQAISRKLDEMQTANMIRRTATPAPVRKQNIEAAFKHIEINKSPVMQKEFNLSVSSQMQTVDARVLPPPELKYAEKTMRAAKGIWQLQQFNQAKNLEDNSWTILNLSGGQGFDNSLQDFVKLLTNTARDFGMFIGQPQRPFKSFGTNDIRRITEFFTQYKNLKLIIVIIPDRTDVTYGNVKKITEMDIGVLTQCMKLRTLQRANPATIKNILQKVNSKLNGINHILNKMPSCLSNCPCMLVGADVTHPAPDSKDVPSIAAVAASRNTLAFQYNVTLRLQPPKEEMILDLEAIILSQLNIYYQETRCSPRRIIYYRDGVSEGQLPQVMFYEINAIKNAIRSFNKDEIEITCLVVQKRHHIRLFPTNPRESDDRHGNVRAGTIVDTTITHPEHIDFYLVSHASIQGTARPTKYRCIWNDSKFNEDQLEEMTYFLCHMYARCTRSVSYPAPTYYAHLAAFRGRALLQGNRNINLGELEREQRNFQIKMGATPMYFV